MQFAFVLAWLPILVAAVRKQGGVARDTQEDSVHHAATSHNSAEAHTGTELSVGTVLSERYLLSERISKETQPGKQFPNILGTEYTKTKHIEKGLYTDDWKAYDKVTKKYVMVKILYDSEKNEYLNWESADEAQKDIMMDHVRQCAITKKILDNAKKHVGSSRICECIHEEITYATETDWHVYLVYEMCGKPMTTALQKETDMYHAHNWLKQVAEALAFLEMFDPPLIHHDLNPQNIFFDDDDVKITGFDGTLKWREEPSFGQSRYTPAYAPPEVADEQGKKLKYAQPVHSFDVYSLGLIYMQMICPQLKSKKWLDKKTQRHRELTGNDIQQLLVPCASAIGIHSKLYEELDLIRRMVSHQPEERPSPMQILTDPQLEYAAWVGQAPGGWPAFDAKQEVYYYNKASSTWTEATISDVRQVDEKKKKTKRYVYDVRGPDGEIKDVDVDLLMTRVNVSIQ